MQKRYQPKWIFILTLIFMLAHVLGSARDTFGTFKDWDYTPHQVVGVGKLIDPVNRTYYKISAINKYNVRVQKINPRGIVTTTYIVTFVDSLLSRHVTLNQWGDTTEVFKFSPMAANEFMVTFFSKGKNGLLPCKGMKYIYKDDLLGEIRYISFDGGLCNNADGVAIERFTKYDDEQRFTEDKVIAFFDQRDSPVINAASDCHRIEYERDERGNELSMACFDTKGKPAQSRYGDAKMLKSYDLYDNEIESATAGAKGEIALSVRGIAKTQMEYDRGLLVKTTCFDAQNNIVKSAENYEGAAITKYEYDERGNELRRSFFDEKEHPMNNHSGVHQIDHKYSMSNMTIETAVFDKDGKATVDRVNVHRYTTLADNKGRPAEVAFFDKNNAPMKNITDQVYIVRYKSDPQGRLVSTSFWRDKNTKMNRWDGFHENRITYNDQGQETESAAYDQNGNSFVTEGGYSKTVTLYNPRCQVSEMLRFNGSVPITLKAGEISNYHSIKYLYDDANRISEIGYYDTLGWPTTARVDFGTKYKCHKVIFVYEGNRIAREKLYVPNNEYPEVIIDCFKSDYISSMGVRRGYKNVESATSTGLTDHIDQDKLDIRADPIVKGLVDSGIALMTKGDAKGAFDYMNRAKQKMPDNYIIQISLGAINWELGNKAECEKNFKYAIVLNPQNPKGYVIYSQMLTAMGRNNEAKNIIRRGLILNPKDSDLIKLNSGFLQGQIELMEKAVKNDSSAENYLNLSLAYYNNERYLDCVNAAETALKIKPDYDLAYNNICSAYNMLHEWDKAIAAGNKALELNPDNERAKNNLKVSLAGKLSGK